MPDLGKHRPFEVLYDILVFAVQLPAFYPQVVLALIVLSGAWSLRTGALALLLVLSAVSNSGIAAAISQVKVLRELESTLALYAHCSTHRRGAEALGLRPGRRDLVKNSQRRTSAVVTGMLNDLELPRMLETDARWLRLVELRPTSPSQVLPAQLMTFATLGGAWIFHTEPFDEFTPSVMFKIHHELGHCSSIDFSTRNFIRTFPLQTSMNVLTILLIAWSANAPLPLLIPLAMLAIASSVMFARSQREAGTLGSELYADAWAVRRVDLTSWGSRSSNQLSRLLFFSLYDVSAERRLRREVFALNLDRLRIGQETAIVANTEPPASAVHLVAQWTFYASSIALPISVAGLDAQRTSVWSTLGVGAGVVLAYLASWVVAGSLVSKCDNIVDNRRPRETE